MPKITITPHGIKGGRAAGMNRKPPPRGLTKGWTTGAARRNRDFLQSIDPVSLRGVAVSATLTLGREAVVTPSDWRTIRERFFDRLRLADLDRLHWVTEFQRGGFPHLHAIIYFPEGFEWATQCVLYHWISSTHDTGSLPAGQHIVEVHRLAGWLQYLAKHGSRSAEYYQRTPPKGWENPGRMWGKLGNWPVSRQELETDPATFYTLRRWARSWRLADARSALARALKTQDHIGAQIARKRILGARRLYARGSQQRSELAGFNEWAKLKLSPRAIAVLLDRPDAFIGDWADRMTPPPEPRQPPDPVDVKDRKGRGADHAD